MSMPNVALIGLFITILSLAGTGFISYGGLSKDVSNNKKDIQASTSGHTPMWTRISDIGQTVTTHDAIIPLVQNDLKEIRMEQRAMNSTMQQILMEVKK